MNIFYQNIFIIPMIAFLVTVILKSIIGKYKLGKWNILKGFSTGGMPSGHSAIVLSITMAMFLNNGIHSEYFALSLWFSAIVIYDALNIRFQAGLHAKEINKIIQKKKFDSNLGHFPSEVFAGSLIGILTATVLFYV